MLQFLAQAVFAFLSSRALQNNWDFTTAYLERENTSKTSTSFCVSCTRLADSSRDFCLRAFCFQHAWSLNLTYLTPYFQETALCPKWKQTRLDSLARSKSNDVKSLQVLHGDTRELCTLWVGFECCVVSWWTGCDYFDIFVSCIFEVSTQNVSCSEAAARAACKSAWLHVFAQMITQMNTIAI